MRVSIYARISSTDKKQDLETQLIPLREYVANRKMFLYKIYTDEMSGSKESRPALDRLMDEAQKRKFDVVLVYRFDRFARSSKQLIRELRKSGKGFGKLIGKQNAEIMK